MSGMFGSTHQDSAGAAAGARLKSERESRGLTIQKVAEDLHLDCWAIEALESGKFTALGAAVHVKGHLRKYAVLLELEPDSLTGTVNDDTAPAPALTPLTAAMPALRGTRAPPKRRKNRRSNKSRGMRGMDKRSWLKMTAIAVAIAVVGVTVWWLLSDRVLVKNEQTAPSQQMDVLPAPPHS